MSDAKPLCSGYLLKQSKGGLWQKRWFELSRSTLTVRLGSSLLGSAARLRKYPCRAGGLLLTPPPPPPPPHPPPVHAERTNDVRLTRHPPPRHLTTPWRRRPSVHHSTTSLKSTNPPRTTFVREPRTEIDLKMVSIVAQTSRVKTARTIDLHLKGEQSAFVEVSTFGKLKIH